MHRAACGAAAHPCQCICRVYCGRAFIHTGRPLSKYTDVIYIYVIYILLAMPNATTTTTTSSLGSVAERMEGESTCKEIDIIAMRD
jgi:hypothetical protein